MPTLRGGLRLSSLLTASLIAIMNLNAVKIAHSNCHFVISVCSQNLVILFLSKFQAANRGLRSSPSISWWINSWTRHREEHFGFSPSQCLSQSIMLFFEMGFSSSCSIETHLIISSFEDSYNPTQWSFQTRYGSSKYLALSLIDIVANNDRWCISHELELYGRYEDQSLD